MVALVDNEGVLRNRLGVNLVGVQEVNEFWLGSGGLLRRNEANIVSGRSGSDLTNVFKNACNMVRNERKTYALENVEALPLGSD